MNEQERQNKINEILKSILSEDEVKIYNDLGISLGTIYGLLKTLDDEGILKHFGEDGIQKIKSSMDMISLYTQKGIESEISQEKANLIREKLIAANLT